MRNGILISFCLLLSLSSCENDDPINITVDEKRAEALLGTSSKLITIDGNELELKAYLWRDFMPTSTPSGQGLISINWLLNVDSVSIPDYIVLSKQFVISGDSIWTTDYSDELRETPDYVIERISRNGPFWEPNTEVTIVAKVVNLSNSTEHYLRLEDQLIMRTD